MSEIKTPIRTLNGHALVDETARQGVAENAQRVSALSEEIGKLGNAGGVSLTAAQVDKCKEYATRINSATGKAEAFLFFTDPHFGGSTTPNASTGKYMRQIAAVYNNTPASMCVCGGDWLNNSNTKENACWQLGVFDGQMKALFDRYVMIIGNHDTNYQGKEYMESGLDGTYDRETHEQCILPANVLRNLWHRKQGASYFVEDGDCTKFYIFDTGLDWYPDMDEYKWEQVDWFANDLLSAKPERSAALLHIAGASASNPTPFISNITQIAKAYNTRSSVTLNSKTYNFSGVTGKFHFILGGHTHKDLSYILNDVVVVMTTNTMVAASMVTFDLVLVDYAAEKIHMVRVGSGNSRTISLVDGSVSEDSGSGDAGGETTVTNLFDIGTTPADYFTYNGNAVDGITVDATNGALIGEAKDSGLQLIYRTAMIENDGSQFRFKATTTNDVNLFGFHGFGIKAYDENGNMVTEWDGGWPYYDYWKSFRLFDANGVSEKIPIETDVTFTLPDNVATFQLGFQFVKPYTSSAGTLVTIKDISLTKE